MDDKKLKFNSKTIHGGQEPDAAYGSVMPPIYQTSTYAQTTPGGHKGYEYSRSANPTRTALEKSLASIENGNYGLAFGSGLAAIDAVIKLLNPGDEVVSTNDLYGGSYRLFKQVFEKFGIKFNFIGMQNADKIGEQILNANSSSERITFIETFLLERLVEKNTIDNIVKSTVETIIEANGQFSVNELSEQNNINRRQLTRKFSSTIGLSPKQLSKTIRIQNTLKTLLTKDIKSLTDLAYENEYFDQAHFIKDFKEFTGLTPKEFYGNDLKMSLIFDSKD